MKKDKFPDFKNRFIKNSYIYSYSTRSGHLYRIPGERLDVCRNSYFVQGLTLWNLLDDDVKFSTNLDTFKNKIKFLLLENNIPYI